MQSRSRPARASRVPWVFLALGFAALAAVLFLARRIRASADEFVVTNRRVMRKTGLVAREIEQVPVEKIQDVTVEQGVLGRLLGYGTVLVETASERMGMLAFPDIARPEAFRNALWGRAADSGAATAASSPAASAPAAR